MRATQSGESFTLLAIDLDRFKEVNDVFGHSVGDALLCEVTARIKDAAEREVVARLGGDEFIVICESGPQPATAEILAERLQSVVSGEIDIAGHRLRIGLSIGVAMFPTDGTDAAMFRAMRMQRSTALKPTAAERSASSSPIWTKTARAAGIAA